ncbi:MAG: hypothetical protein JXR05_09085 [Flavobacteriaceae bacterium]
MNNNNLTSFFALLFFTCFSLFSQTTPHIEGRVFVDMNTGLFRCDFTLSNIQPLEKYAILINKGMNIKSFRDVNQKLINYDGFYDSKVKGEAVEYILGNSKGELYLPESFQVSYVGAFPKYDDSYNTYDFKGFIAINDETIRATEQTKWYPTLYDATNDRLINSYTYNLEVEVKGTSSIFINGSAPQKTSKGVFTSKKAVPLFLFAGNYDFVEDEGNYLINTDVSKKTATQIFQNVKIIQDYLAKSLDQKFDGNIYLINHKAVNKRRAGSSWGFNTYPAFAFTGKNAFGKILDDKGKFDNGSYRYYAHEFGHNYFGNNVQSGNLYWFWLESFPEYLSFTFAEEIGGEAFLKEVIQSKLKSVSDKKYTPLSEVTEASQVTGSYRYNMAPLVLLSFDYEFGRDKTFDVIKELLVMAKKETLTFSHFKKAAVKSGVSAKAYQKFEKTYLSNKNFKENVMNYLKAKL